MTTIAMAGGYSSSIVSQSNRAPSSIPTISLPLTSKLRNNSTNNYNSKQYSIINNPHHRFFRSKRPAATISNCTAKASSTPVSAAPVQQTISPTTSTPTWSEFASKISGEWDGFGADFTTEGKPIELPESVVPEAYREWEVKVFDWQTHCPTLAHPQDLLLTYKTIKLLPTVGCEADAATRHSIDERVVGGVDNNVSAFAYQSGGSYAAVWPVVDNGQYKQLELEHCLINPRDKESRMRIIQVVRVANTGIELQSIRVFCEQWYGPFRNGDQLGGCAIRDSAFASTTALKASEVVGVWQGPSAVSAFDSSQNVLIQELIDDKVRKTGRDEHNLILLPKQLWCSLEGHKGGETLCEVGWLFDHGCAVTSRCIFSSDVKLKASCYKLIVTII
ncbi:hypothetical protein SADUNF_Sadunf09G0135400 [Salix dunnii]|uniref:Uncharacterized protein n=1 Tax=Salix dunnii TaxID=1413687 RepID=A0A835JTV8_9ROSI|nr:hypothetical protein SADUNF_Sadunf09G0135400 [Salix dunnii]